jgi:hypothetical protein
MVKSDLGIAKDIYHFLQTDYTCIDDEDVFSYMDLLIVLKNKRNSRGINLLLMAAIIRDLY